MGMLQVFYRKNGRFKQRWEKYRFNSKISVLNSSFEIDNPAVYLYRNIIKLDDSFETTKTILVYNFKSKHRLIQIVYACDTCEIFPDFTWIQLIMIKKTNLYYSL